jgi:predicted nucleic-acid-binding protein
VITADTNILVRIITNDDRAQSSRAAALLSGEDEVFIAKTVILELEWMLRSAYRIARPQIASALHMMLAMENAACEDLPSVEQAPIWYERGMDFADAIHIASGGRERRLATFDRALRRSARRLNACPIADL